MQVITAFMFDFKNTITFFGPQIFVLKLCYSFINIKLASFGEYLGGGEWAGVKDLSEENHFTQEIIMIC